MKYFNSRTWHAWISVVLALPILIVAVTAVFIAHHDALGIKDIPVNAQWLPGYGEAAMKAEKMEVRSGLATTSGVQYVGTKTGLYRIEGGRAVAVQALVGKEVRALLETPDGLLAATKQGLWRETREGWQKMASGEAWNLSTAPGSTLLAAFKNGLMKSQDGGASWQQDEATMTALAARPMGMEKEAFTLNHLVMDLHTGKAFFGKEAEWIWIDLIGAVMAFLTLTGIYLWWRGERRKLTVQGGGA